MILFLPFWCVVLFTVTPLRKAESLAVAVITFCIWLRLWAALIDESDVGA